MKRPIIDMFDRAVLRAHRQGLETLTGACLEVRLEWLKLRRECQELAVEIYERLKEITR